MKKNFLSLLFPFIYSCTYLGYSLKMNNGQVNRADPANYYSRQSSQSECCKPFKEALNSIRPVLKPLKDLLDSHVRDFKDSKERIAIFVSNVTTLLRDNRIQPIMMSLNQEEHEKCILEYSFARVVASGSTKVVKESVQCLSKHYNVNISNKIPYLQCAADCTTPEVRQLLKPTFWDHSMQMICAFLWKYVSASDWEDNFQRAQRDGWLLMNDGSTRKIDQSFCRFLQNTNPLKYSYADVSQDVRDKLIDWVQMTYLWLTQYVRDDDKKDNFQRALHDGFVDVYDTHNIDEIEPRFIKFLQVINSFKDVINIADDVKNKFLDNHYKYGSATCFILFRELQNGVCDIRS